MTYCLGASLGGWGGIPKASINCASVTPNFAATAWKSGRGGGQMFAQLVASLALPTVKVNLSELLTQM
jgi:hypothetical protein